MSAKAKCNDCGLAYGRGGFADLIVPDNVWELINPSDYVGGGLLCPNCICARLRRVEHCLIDAGVEATIYAPSRSD